MDSSQQCMNLFANGTANGKNPCTNPAVDVIFLTGRDGITFEQYLCAKCADLDDESRVTGHFGYKLQSPPQRL